MNLINRITNKVVLKTKSLFFNSGYYTSVFSIRKGGVLLMYHGVDSLGSAEFNTRHTGKKCFDKHINFLINNTNVLPLVDFKEENFNPNKLNVAITFDDGYLNNYTNAAPILERYKCPATFFITGINNVEDKILWADFVNIISKLTNKNVVIEGEEFENRNAVYYSKESDKSLYDVIKFEKPYYEYKLKLYKAFEKEYQAFTTNAKYDEYWKLVNDEQITELAKSNYITIGSHAYYHNNLGSIALQDAESELIESKKYLENLTQKPITTLAYPDGSYSREVLTVANNLGFSTQLAADYYLYNEDETDPRIQDRMGIYTTYDCANQLLLTFN